MVHTGQPGVGLPPGWTTAVERQTTTQGIKKLFFDYAGSFAGCFFVVAAARFFVLGEPSLFEVLFAQDIFGAFAGRKRGKNPMTLRATLGAFHKRLIRERLELIKPIGAKFAPSRLFINLIFVNRHQKTSSSVTRRPNVSD
jgi:hypothetical protein